MNPKSLSCLLFIALISHTTSAQEPTQGRLLTMSDAVAMSYENSLSMAAAKSNVKASIHLKKAAWGLGAPKISVGAEYTYMSQDIGHFDFNGPKNAVVNFLGQLPLPLPPEILTGLNAMDLSYTLQKQQFAMVGATLVVPIFTGGKINAINRAAKIKVEGANNTLAETYADLFSEITERYWGLALAQNIQNLQARAVTAIAAHASDAAQLEANGIIARGERLYADMALSQARAALTQAQGNTTTINTALSGTLGVTDTYVPVTPLFINRQLPPLDYFQEQTQKNSHLLEKAKLMERLAKELVKVERADFFPTIGAMGGATLWNYNLTNQIPRWSVGAGIKWTLFDGLTREHSYAAARQQAKAAEAINQKAQIDIKTLVEKLYYTLKSATADFDATASTIKFATEYLRMKTQAFAEGMATSNDVVDAQLNLDKANLQRMATAYQFDTTLAKLLAVAGLSSDYSVYQTHETNTTIQ